jgi:hypothetical protein
VLADQGVSDKRLLAIEPEFSGILKQFLREGNTLSNILRLAWDRKRALRTRTRNSPLQATEAHISAIAHATPDDLRRYLTDLDVANGTANRFIYVFVERARLRANPARIPSRIRAQLEARLVRLLERARVVEEVGFSNDFEARFEDVYAEMSKYRPGLLGALLDRGPAHVRRLALIYYLLDLEGAASPVIEQAHLESALAFWDVSVRSVERLFAQRTGSDALDRILLELLPGQTMTLEEVRREIFSGHLTARGAREALTLGVELGELEVGRDASNGRPARGHRHPTSTSRDRRGRRRWDRMG